MALCKICKKRKICKEMCPALTKEISARGISPRMKDKTYTVDFSLFEGSQNLNAFQLEIKHKLTQNTFLKKISEIDLQNIARKHLTKRERQAIQFFLKGYRHQEIADRMKISCARVNALIKAATRKLKYFFGRG